MTDPTFILLDSPTFTRVDRKRSEYKNSDRLRSDSDRLPINVDRQGRIENEAINVDRQAINIDR